MERVNRPCLVCRQRKRGDRRTGVPQEVRLLESQLRQQDAVGEQDASPAPCRPPRRWPVPGGLLCGCRGLAKPGRRKAPGGLSSVLALLCVDREPLEDQSLVLQVDGRAPPAVPCGRGPSEHGVHHWGVTVPSSRGAAGRDPVQPGHFRTDGAASSCPSGFTAAWGGLCTPETRSEGRPVCFCF